MRKREPDDGSFFRRIASLAGIATVTSLLLPLVISCGHTKPGVGDAVRNNPAKDIRNFAYDLSVPTAERIRPAPGILIEYLNTMDSTDAYADYTPTDGERRLFEEYLSYLPEVFKTTMTEKLIGVYFIRNFAGGGLSDFVFDADGSMYAILAINPDVLSTPLNDWIAFRDNSTFGTGEGRRIGNSLGNEYKGLLHTLTHESAHIYDYFNHATPFTEPILEELGFGTKERTEFVSGVWSGYDRPVREYEFEHRTKLPSYGLGGTAEPGLMIPAYSALGKTPFASAYGSRSWAEDFAETFAWFYLYENLNLRYDVTINERGETILTFHPLENGTALRRYEKLRTTIR